MTGELVWTDSLTGIGDGEAHYDARDAASLYVQAKSAQHVKWQGNQCLRVEDGLVILPPQFNLVSGRVEVQVAAEQAAYPGIAFHIADPLNFELAYTQPHTSGKWDALQYDPVFHGSNTWQIHFGPCFQKEAVVPTGSWYSVRLDFDKGSARLGVGDQPPLTIGRLAHRHKLGKVGLWTYRPAYFRNLKIYSGEGDQKGHPEPGQCYSSSNCPEQSTLHGSLISEWFLEGYGTVEAEPSGLVLLNRYLPSQVTRATLTRSFEVSRDTRVDFSYGFTDIFSLSVDGVTIFSGSDTFSGMGDRDARGYAEVTNHAMAWDVKAGAHIIKVVVEMKEPFGWGFGFSAHADGLRLLPAWMG